MNVNPMNPTVQFLNGELLTNDEELNRIIRAVETESGASLAAATMAVTFDDDPASKIYLILLTLTDDKAEDVTKDWEISIGRQETYDYLKDLVKYEAINPNESFIISGDAIVDENTQQDNIEFNNVRPITVFRFLKFMYENRKVLDDAEDFDIDEYDPENYEKGDKTLLTI